MFKKIKMETMIFKHHATGEEIEVRIINQAKNCIVEDIKTKNQYALVTDYHKRKQLKGTSFFLKITKGGKK